jgi:hypothetical protein
MENAIAAEPFEGASRYKLDYTLDKMVVGSVSAIDLSYWASRAEILQQAFQSFRSWGHPRLDQLELCFQIRKLNKRIIWTPYSEVYSSIHEKRNLSSLSQSQILEFKKRWSEFYTTTDPYYNIHLDLRSSRAYRVRKNYLVTR